MSWAILLLIVAYSPIGSPDLYIKGNFVVQNQGINFKSGIENASHVRRILQSEETDLAVPNYTPKLISYTVNQGTKPFRATSQTSYSVSTPANKRTTTMPGSGVTGAVGGSAFFGSRHAAQGKIAPQMNGMSLSADLADAGDLGTNRQFASMETTGGVTDPGDDPVEPPISVGEGYWFLLLLAVGYAGVKIGKMKFKDLNI